MANPLGFQLVIEAPTMGELLLFTQRRQTEAGDFVTFPLWFCYPSGRREIEFFTWPAPDGPHDLIRLIEDVTSRVNTDLT